MTRSHGVFPRIPTLPKLYIINCALLHASVVLTGEFSGLEPPAAYALLYGRSIVVCSDLPNGHFTRFKRTIRGAKLISHPTISSPSATPTTTLHIRLACYIGPCLSTDMSHNNAFRHAPWGLHVPLDPCMHCKHCELFRHVSIAPDGFPGRLRHASYRLSLPYKTPLTSRFILLPLQLHYSTQQAIPLRVQILTCTHYVHVFNPMISAMLVYSTMAYTFSQHSNCSLRHSRYSSCKANHVRPGLHLVSTLLQFPNLSAPRSLLVWDIC